MQPRYTPDKKYITEFGTEAELDRLYKPNDPRRLILDHIDFNKVEYQRQAQAIVSAIENNPAGYSRDELWDPPVDWARDLHYGIVSGLNEVDWRSVSIIPTIKTAADIYHGIDFLVVYHEKQTEREVILSVDLSLRKKEDFKADLLVTQYGAKANSKFYSIPEFKAPFVHWQSKKEEDAHKQKTNHTIGLMIAAMITYKLRREQDPNYVSIHEEDYAVIRREILELLEGPPSSAGSQLQKSA